MKHGEPDPRDRLTAAHQWDVEPHWLQPPRLAATLTTRTPTAIPTMVAPKRAAVAVILRPGAGGVEVLLMKRAERPGDRWSGQISMPGGMAATHDADLRATAMRETREEVDLDLGSAVALGRLDDQVAMARGRVLPMAITPWVFAVEAEVAPRPLDEAVAVFWMPLGPVLRGEFNDVWRYEMAGLHHDLPAWRVQGHLVWGLTHRMLSRLLDVAAP